MRSSSEERQIECITISSDTNDSTEPSLPPENIYRRKQHIRKPRTNYQTRVQKIKNSEEWLEWLKDRTKPIPNKIRNHDRIIPPKPEEVAKKKDELKKLLDRRVAINELCRGPTTVSDRQQISAERKSISNRIASLKRSISVGPRTYKYIPPTKANRGYRARWAMADLAGPKRQRFVKLSGEMRKIVTDKIVQEHAPDLPPDTIDAGADTDEESKEDESKPLNILASQSEDDAIYEIAISNAAASCCEPATDQQIKVNDVGKSDMYYGNSHRRKYMLTQTESRRMLKEKQKLTKIPVKATTYSGFVSSIRKFNNVMTLLKRHQVPTPKNIVDFIAYCVAKEFRPSTIESNVTALKYHKNRKLDWYILKSDPLVVTAMKNIRKQLKEQDTRIPASPTMIDNFSAIADRDFSPRNAIMVKGAMWIAFMCMLRRSEYCHSLFTPRTKKGRINHKFKRYYDLYDFSEVDHAVTIENVRVHKTGGVYFSLVKGHKNAQCIDRLRFPFIPGTEKRAYKE